MIYESEIKMKITQQQFDDIVDLIGKIQEVCVDADTTSINMWLTMVEVDD